MLVSIIIPAYNREKLIVEALSSVVKQSWRPVEVIVVDDGSSDGTAEVAEKFASEARDAGVHFRILRKANGGSTAARNAGIEVAQGDCLLFLDSDDVLSFDGLTSLAESLSADEELDFTYGKVVIGDEELQPTGEKVGKAAEDLLKDPVTYHWHTMAGLYRRGLVSRCGGWDQTADGSDDWVFQSRVKFAARKTRFVDVEVGIWRQHLDERLGATSFRESYTVDVTKCCLAIHQQWTEAGRLDPRGKRRLYLRALRHCWELGCHGSRKERNEALIRVRRIGRGSLFLVMCSTIIASIPVACDRLLFRLIRR